MQLVQTDGKLRLEHLGKEIFVWLLLVFFWHDGGEPLWGWQLVELVPSHEVEALVAYHVALILALLRLEVVEAHRGIAQAFVGCQTALVLHVE